jgi:putative FmdB family regulatory protein
MPIYEYGCEDCNEVFDALRKASERETASCPTCNGTAKQRVTAPAGIRMRGQVGGARAASPGNPFAGMSTANIPTVDRDGKLRDVKTGRVLAE